MKLSVGSVLGVDVVVGLELWLVMVMVVTVMVAAATASRQGEEDEALESTVFSSRPASSI